MSEMVEKLVAREEASLAGWRCLAVVKTLCDDGAWYIAQVERKEPYYFIAAVAERTPLMAVRTAFKQARAATSQGEQP